MDPRTVSRGSCDAAKDGCPAALVISVPFSLGSGKGLRNQWAQTRIWFTGGKKQDVNVHWGFLNDDQRAFKINGYPFKEALDKFNNGDFMDLTHKASKAKSPTMDSILQEFQMRIEQLPKPNSPQPAAAGAIPSVSCIDMLRKGAAPLSAPASDLIKNIAVILDSRIENGPSP